MQAIQLYIEGQRVELFDDESVNITQTIKNVRDIEKVFTDFTRQFTIPASKTNNKIFKHYYNFDIVNGFDARVNKSANIELNFLPFRKGKLKLDGVDMRNNKPYAYKVTFYGNTVSLKDLLGDDKLNDLDDLGNLTETFSPTAMEAGLKRNPSSNDIIVPLITHSKRLYYNSAENTKDTGNLYYQSGQKHGVAWNELKYAIRVAKIIDAIESKYGITFSTDFFDSSNEPYYNLFMWLHRKKGFIENVDPNASYSKLINDWTAGSGTAGYMLTTSIFQADLDKDYIDNFDLVLTQSVAQTYSISILLDGVEIYSETGINQTSKTIDLTSNWPEVYLIGGQFTVVISHNNASGISFSNIKWTVTYTLPDDPPDIDNFETSTVSVPASFDFIVSQQIPEMKVLDFLKGLFVMFNLVAEVEDDGTVYVDTLDNYYTNRRSNSEPYDITKYIDVTKGQVNTALPYREIVFGYEDTDTFLAASHNQLFNQEWGTVEYTESDDSGNNVSGEIYNVKAPFGHMKFERLIDVNDETVTTIQWGWSTDDNQDAYIGKPLLFYPIFNSLYDGATAISISYVDVVNGGNSYDSHKAITGSINMPFNSVRLSSFLSKANINFNLEKNEYTRTSDFTDTLFEVYYKTYIQNVFQSSNRLTKVTAYLPLRILLNYNLADRFRIADRDYKINSIQTNLLTGKSEIELIND